MSEAVHLYHDGTKHHIYRFARSLGYLDWASQPNPFRSFPGAAAFALPPRPDAPAHLHGPLTAAVIGDVLRHSLGLTAWKQFGESRWSLRVNPSSGNLHPTEAYFVSGPLSGLASAPAVYHYAPDRHALEQRCAFDDRAWNRATADGRPCWLIALTSIHWREAWKYGERAFRYCQHDMGHAIAAVRIAAARAGLDAGLLPGWSHRDIAALTGIDRDEDFIEAEREEPGCLIGLRPRAPGFGPQASGLGPQVSGLGPQASGLGESARSLVDAIRSGTWSGRASRLSEAHVQWSFIDDIARATEDPGRPSVPPALSANVVYPASVILQRRSAVAFDGRSSIDTGRFFTMLSRVMPVAGSPFDALWWDARIHLALFVHRVDGLEPGMYLLVRNPAATDRVRAAFGREFLWESVTDTLPLVRLARGECSALARRLSCDQDIAADGFFSLGMIADFDASLREFGPSFYRHLFWESGSVGQVLYLEAELAGARATGIGCFYDDPVHDVFGLTGHAFQSLYHFTVGMPVDDARLTTEPGYLWESEGAPSFSRRSTPN